MSLFSSVAVACPSCGKPNDFQLVASVNADRRPDLRDAILDGTFQLGTCSSCGTQYKPPPTMTYIDVGRSQWILVRPSESLTEWALLEEHARRSFDGAFGSGAPASAREIGKAISPRVTFGWPALREKILCVQHGLDELWLEMLKASIMRDVPGGRLGDDVELRLEAVEGDPEGDQLIMGWVDPRSERSLGAARVPADILQDLAAEPEVWSALSGGLAGRAYLDINRLLVDPDPVA